MSLQLEHCAFCNTYAECIRLAFDSPIGRHPLFQMSACSRPRNLLVGWTCYEPFRLQPSLPSKLRPHHLTQQISTSATKFRSSGGPDCGSGCFHSKVAKPRYTAHQPGYEQNQLTAICVTVIGASRCSLCSKAVLAIRRVIASLTPPLSYRARPAELPPCEAYPQEGHVGNTPNSTGLRRQRAIPYKSSGSACGDQVTVGTVTYSGNGSGVSVRSGTPDQAHVPPNCCQVGQEAVREVEGRGESKDRQVASADVPVHLKEVNLDHPSDWQQLGMPEAEARALRREVPIVLIGGREACRQKFDGPAVRAALLKEIACFGRKSK